MVKILSVLGLAAAVTVASASLGAADEANVTRQMRWDGAPHLDIGVPGQITFTQSPTVSFRVSGPRRLVDKVYLENGRAGMLPRNSWFWGDRSRYARELHLDISAPHMNALGVHSAGSLTIVDLREDHLDLRVHSAAVARGMIAVRTLDAEVHSAAKLNVGGRVENLDLEVHSAASADLSDLVVANARVNVHSAGSAVLNPTQSADATAHSAASVRLLSRPVMLRTNVHSAGSIRTP